MATNEFSISAKTRKIISAEGYVITTSMAPYIQQWRAWYTGNDDFYTVHYIDSNGRKHKRDRASLHPARKVCREMASLILTDETEVSVDAPRANEWLQNYIEHTNFWPTGQVVVEQSFSLGTAAWALMFEVDDDSELSAIKLCRYDARMVVPLSWDDAGVSECAFVSRITIDGKPTEQLQMMVLDKASGTYHIKTWLIQDKTVIDPEAHGIIADFDTKSAHKPFGIFKPGIENVYDDLSPYGASIFADAVGVIRAVDTVFDAMIQEVSLKEVRVFLDEGLLDVRDSKGNELPTADLEKQAYRKIAGKEGKDLMEVFSPDIRSEQLRSALNMALAELGDTCGFGTDYFTLDKPGGAITAKEVVASGSVLMRTVRKHENVIRGAIQDVVNALLDCARIYLGANIEEDFGAVNVSFDDSIITDTQTEKALMLSEVSAGVVPKWMYLKKFYGLSDEEAKAEVGTEAQDGGY